MTHFALRLLALAFSAVLMIVLSGCVPFEGKENSYPQDDSKLVAYPAPGSYTVSPLNPEKEEDKDLEKATIDIKRMTNNHFLAVFYENGKSVESSESYDAYELRFYETGGKTMLMVAAHLSQEFEERTVYYMPVLIDDDGRLVIYNPDKIMRDILSKRKGEDVGEMKSLPDYTPEGIRDFLNEVAQAEPSTFTEGLILTPKPEKTAE